MGGIKLKPEEEIVYTVHQHGFVYFWSWLMSLVLLTGTSYFLFWLLEQGWWGEVIVATGYAIGVILLFRIILFWKGNAFIITTDRIIDVHRASMFDKEVTQIQFEDVEDVSGRIKGFWGTIFRTGSIRVQAKKGSIAVTLPHVRNPLVVQDAILDMLDDIKKQKKKQSEPLTKEDVLAYCKALDTRSLHLLLRDAMNILKEKKEE